jgi:hypothetical protein
MRSWKRRIDRRVDFWQGLNWIHKVCVKFDQPFIVFRNASRTVRERSRKWSGVFVAVSAWIACGTVAETDFDHIDWNKERQFWAFTPPKAPERPVVKNRRWPREDLDYFVLAKLEERRLSPSLEADKRTLLRRASYDLTGLPPSEELAARFLRDSRPGAYERLVDELIAMPGFGERMASMWLPLARYAEDQAHQVGNDTKFFYPNAYKYRKWVIDAFNHDLPYQVFREAAVGGGQILRGRFGKSGGARFFGAGTEIL